MAIESAQPARATARQIPVRKISAKDVNQSLRDGLNDFLAMRGDLIFVGLLYPLIGFAAAILSANEPLMPFFLPVAAGVGLLGPVAAIGFYELARRREAGQTSNWLHFFDVRKRPAIDDIGVVIGLLLALFAAWLIAAGVLYVVLFGWTAPSSIGSFVATVFTTPRGWAMIAAGLVVGAVFAWIVLAISVASLPMLVDGDVDAADAISASWRAAHANRAEMFRWGLVVAGLLVLGSIPLFIGLAFVLPWLGYATWHLYTRLIDRKAISGQHKV